MKINIEDDKMTSFQRKIHIMTTIFLGSDHAGFALKEFAKEHLDTPKYAIIDIGAFELNEKDDYPDFAALVAEKVIQDPESVGILFCGSGQGVCIVANKFAGIRAAIGFSESAAEQSRVDDNCNVLCLPALHISKEEALQIINSWLNSSFSQLERHARRLSKIADIESRLLK